LLRLDDFPKQPLESALLAGDLALVSQSPERLASFASSFLDQFADDFPKV
jgi:hypothetical protein